MLWGDGEIMFTFASDQVKSTDESLKVAKATSLEGVDAADNRLPNSADGTNFRVFKADESYGDPFLKSQNPAQPLVVYVGVSIMSSLFTKYDTVHHMMSEINKAYPDALIVYVCGDGLQKITEYLLHEDKAVKNINDARKKWKKHHDAASVNEEKRMGTKPKQVELYWDSVTKHPSYAVIRQFVDILLTLQPPTTESLATAYPNVSSSFLELCNDISNFQSKIAPKVQANADYFATRNTNALATQLVVIKKAEEKEYQAKLMAYRRDKAKRHLNGSSPTPPVLKTEKEIEDEQKQDILSATYEYNAEEIAAFILFDQIRNTRQIQTGFNLELSDVLLNEEVTPVLAYPISASVNAANTFNICFEVMTLYKKYAPQLGLPTIEELLTVVDSFIPESLRVSKPRSGSVGTAQNAGQVNSSDSSLYQQDIIAVDGEIVAESGLKPAHAPSSGQVANGAASLASHAAFYANTKSNEAKKAKTADEITDTIFSIVEAQTRLDVPLEKNLYQNGITCEITITKIESEVINKSRSVEEKEKRLGAMRDLIKAEVKLALAGAVTTGSFPYEGYQYNLLYMPTDLAKQQELRNSSGEQTLRIREQLAFLPPPSNSQQGSQGAMKNSGETLAPRQ